MVKKEMYKDISVMIVVSILHQKEEKTIPKNYLKSIFGTSKH